MSMDTNGKIIFAKHSEIQQANLKNLTGTVRFWCVIYSLVYLSVSQRFWGKQPIPFPLRFLAKLLLLPPPWISYCP